MMDSLIIELSEDDAGQRLDKALTAHCDLSRSYLQQLMAQGNVFFAGAPLANPAAKARMGTYTIQVPEAEPLGLEPVAMDLNIIHEDDHLLVINKPAGLTVHPAAGTTEPTLVHGLLAHCADSLSGIGGVARPGIVHRLDKDTSGLMLVAKTDAAHQHLSAQLKDRSLSRTYAALCWGAPMPPAGTVDAPIGRHPKDRTRMAVVKRGGKDARTHYETIERFAFASHIRCKLESGRTHQIRVHLNHLGHGLIGDPVYGQSTEKRLKAFEAKLPPGVVDVASNASGVATATAALLKFTRQALHARRIEFRHPSDESAHAYEAPLPEDMQELLDVLEH